MEALFDDRQEILASASYTWRDLPVFAVRGALQVDAPANVATIVASLDSNADDVDAALTELTLTNGWVSFSGPVRSIRVTANGSGAVNAHLVLVGAR